MGHVNKTYFLTLKTTLRFKKKPEGEGRDQWSVDTKKLGISRGRGGLVARPWPRGWRIPGSKLDFTVWGPLRAKSHVVAKRHPVGVVLERGQQAQVFSSSSDRSSKCPEPSPNNPRVA
ncbi:hypothetical protein AVEN_171368-1 [Araneus ventricosus]|uniref:Uncharacterized protein n=1 Tax=Araneus ventricosus TaxID=182803 RepID=A0A4Y2JU85_ARAVE|nr:hypothetical protein AVEN_171368-1 [Araneus ventricosus]